MQSNELKKSFLELLEKDPEFRYAVAGYIGLEDIRSSVRRLEDAVARLLEAQARNEERFARIEERIVALEERVVKLDERIADNQARNEERFARIEEELRDLRQETNNLRKDMQEAITRLDNRITMLDIRMSALGARWGMMNEHAVRNALKGIVGRDLGYNVIEWNVLDQEGYVYGYSSNVQLDVVISNGKAILLEIASHVKRSDPIILKRKSELYKRIEGREIARLVFVTPFIDDDARDACNRLGIEVYTT